MEMNNHVMTGSPIMCGWSSKRVVMVCVMNVSIIDSTRVSNEMGWVKLIRSGYFQHCILICIEVGEFDSVSVQGVKSLRWVG